MKILIEYRPTLYNPPRNSPLILGESKSLGMTIIAGVNSYSKEDWDNFNKNPRISKVVKSLMEDRILTVISSPSSKEENPPLPKDLTEAVTIISKTNSTKLLKSWQDTDPRAGVQNAIASVFTRIEEKKAANKKDTKDTAGVKAA